MTTWTRMGWMVVLVSAVGCDPPKDTPVQDYYASAAKAACSWFVRCQYMADEATCMASYGEATRQMAKRLEGKLTVDEALATECLAAYETRSCDSLSNRLESEAASRACLGVIVDERPDGATCIASFQCTSRYCAGANIPPTDSCLPPDGVCAPRPPLPEGDECSEDDIYMFADCPTGSVCLCATGPCTCQTLEQADAGACRIAFDCPDGELCLGATSTTNGQCQRLPALGEACLSQGALRCAPDLACDPTTLTCAHYLGAGETCSDATPPCAGFADCVDGICTAWGQPGDTCQDDLDCGFMLSCVDHVCAIDLGCQ